MNNSTSLRKFNTASLSASGDAAATLALAPVLLTVHNCRNDGAAAQLLFFKKNSAAADTAAVAWKVVRCGAGQHARVVYPFEQQVGVFNSGGLHAGLAAANAGEQLTIAASAAGACAQLVRLPPAPAAAQAAEAGWSTPVGANMIGVSNTLAERNFDVVLYKDGRALCRHSQLAPGQLALFEVLPYLHVANGAGMAEGDVIDTARTADATRISLLGLKSADLIVTGTGAATQMKLINQRFS